MSNGDLDAETMAALQRMGGAPPPATQPQQAALAPPPGGGVDPDILAAIQRQYGGPGPAQLAQQPQQGTPPANGPVSGVPSAPPLQLPHFGASVGKYAPAGPNAHAKFIPGSSATASDGEQTIGYTPKAATAPTGGGGGGGVSYRPGGYIPNERDVSTTEGVRFSPDTTKALDESQRLAREGLDDEAKAAQKKREAEARLAPIQDATEQADIAHQQLVAEHQQKELKRQQGAMDEMATQVRDEKIDPKHFWDSKSTGDKITTGIGLFLGGFAAGLNGTPNFAMQKFNKEMDADIDAQKENHAHHVAGLGDLRSAYSMARERFGDANQADLAARIAAKEHFAAQVKRATASTDDLDQQGRAKMLLAQNEKEIAQLRGKFDADASTRITTRASEHYQPGGYVGGGAPAVDNTIDIKNDSELVDVGGGHMMKASSPEDAQKIRAAQAAEGKVRAIQAEARRIYEANPHEALIPGTTAYTQISALQEKAIPLQSVATGQGVVREYEREPTLRALGLSREHTDYIPGVGQTPQERLDFAMKNQEGGSKDLIAAQRGLVVRPVDVRNAHGKIERKYQYVAPSYTPGGGEKKKPPPGFKP